MAELSLEERLAIMEKVRGEQAKRYGDNAIMRADATGASAGIEVIPTGSPQLDVALGVGGYPRGRVIEIYGPESSGKTTLAIHAMIEAQRAGGANKGIVGFVDVEHAFDMSYAVSLGLDKHRMFISQPESGEEAMEILEAYIRSGVVEVAVLDSVAALITRKEIEGEMGDPTMAAQARLMSSGLRKLIGAANTSKCVLIFTNQLREKVGFVLGNPEVQPGGRALKFYSTVRLDIRRRDSVKSGSDIIGNVVRIKVVKNKVAPPFMVADNVQIMYGKGIDKFNDLMELGPRVGAIDKKGNTLTFSYTNAAGESVEIKEVGKEKFKAAMNRAAGAQEALELLVRQKAKEVPLEEAPVPDLTEADINLEDQELSAE